MCQASTCGKVRAGKKNLRMGHYFFSVFNNSRKNNGQAFWGTMSQFYTIAIITVHSPGQHLWLSHWLNLRIKKLWREQQHVSPLTGSVPCKMAKGVQRFSAPCSIEPMSPATCLHQCIDLPQKYISCFSTLLDWTYVSCNLPSPLSHSCVLIYLKNTYLANLNSFFECNSAWFFYCTTWISRPERHQKSWQQTFYLYKLLHSI